MIRTKYPSPEGPGEHWSMDFISDSLIGGSRFRALTLVDNFSRESPAIEVGQSMTGTKVVEVLERLRLSYGTPERISVDNGPEFISKALDQWAYQNGVQLSFSRPGKPTDNPFIESFNGSLRQECLNTHWFRSIAEAEQIIEAWRRDYNEVRPHSSIKNLTPVQYREQHQRAGKKTQLQRAS
jgi:putative transposase